MIAFLVGLVIGFPVGYQVRRIYARELWRLSRTIRDKARGIDRDSF